MGLHWGQTAGIQFIRDVLHRTKESRTRHCAGREKLRVFCYSKRRNTRCRAFRDILKNAGVSATLRLEKGHDIDAACGQLRLKQETQEGIIAPAPARR